LKDHSLNKYYLCIVKGKVEEKKRIEAYLSKDEEKNQVKVFANQMENTDYICTEYEPIAYSKNVLKELMENKFERQNADLPIDTSSGEVIPKIESVTNPSVLGVYTLLQVKLITGKSHQIRAHLASIGHPIIGDYKYGDQRTNHYFKKNYDLSYQLLHSYQMVFPEIIGELSYLSGKSFRAQLPEQFEKIKKSLF
jgi:23S rRNA pseudouridine955/2504/2580 synthase